VLGRRRRGRGVHPRLGFKESAVQWVPVSGQEGQNLWAAPTEAALADWWPGPTLVRTPIGFLRALLNSPLNCQGPVEIPIEF
jgi:translation elongation factor EF-1alpha